MEPSVSRQWFEQAFRRTVEAALTYGALPEDDNTLAEVGLDSLRTLTLFMDLEREFHSLWPVEKMVTMANCMTVGDLREAAWDVLVCGEQ